MELINEQIKTISGQLLVLQNKLKDLNEQKAKIKYAIKTNPELIRAKIIKHFDNSSEPISVFGDCIPIVEEMFPDEHIKIGKHLLTFGEEWFETRFEFDLCDYVDHESLTWTDSPPNYKLISDESDWINQLDTDDATEQHYEDLDSFDKIRDGYGSTIQIDAEYKELIWILSLSKPKPLNPVSKSP